MFYWWDFASPYCIGFEPMASRFSGDYDMACVRKLLHLLGKQDISAAANPAHSGVGKKVVLGHDANGEYDVHL